MMVENYSYIVRAHCATYNHSAYITDAMNGFVMQQTDFPFVCTIMDDASTDGEQDVIRRFVEDNFDLKDASVAYERDTDYGHVTFAQHKTNKNCFFALILLKENHYSQRKSKAPYLTEWMDTKYIALCEGDDYWTDPLKLQKQVDFLETHKDYAICFHEAKIFNQSTGGFVKDDIRTVPSETNIMELAKGNYIHTQTVVYRNDPLVERERAEIGRVAAGDYVLHMLNAKHGKIKKLPDCMAVYRLNNESVWGTKDATYRIPLWNEMLIRLLPFFDNDVQEVLREQYKQNCNCLVRIGADQVRQSKAYRLGKMFLKPFSWIQKRKIDS
ncbi:MAG: hypothetical protein IKM99_07535 [Bacteroidales bacterium]|nr:hypothetical protein [Bacteroidales bacterium]